MESEQLKVEQVLSQEQKPRKKLNKVAKIIIVGASSVVFLFDTKGKLFVTKINLADIGYFFFSVSI
jgi:hypothetical protein